MGGGAGWVKLWGRDLWASWEGVYVTNDVVGESNRERVVVFFLVTDMLVMWLSSG